MPLCIRLPRLDSNRPPSYRHYDEYTGSLRAGKLFMGSCHCEQPRGQGRHDTQEEWPVEQLDG